ncbi:hypothetical protein P378_05200 [Desulforamulus profundi]|uniref:TNase-like domain-containing protein n=1 Tax=Desulforamulus profundi TaxID=1383067 RepID=A0A2C6MHC7_9FIRM|nr:hypothetical protein [Desulforamulus profundi]PHJ39144.1 hypothetical protein P378_05200 [Desulforamulus profundi]
MLDGYAQVMTIPHNVKYADLFVKLQREAREGDHGLWGSGGQHSQDQGQAAHTVPAGAAGKGPGPHGETIKGNINSKGEKIYHVPGGRYYDKANLEAWFFTEEDAQAAGYRRSKV